MVTQSYYFRSSEIEKQTSFWSHRGTQGDSRPNAVGVAQLLKKGLSLRSVTTNPVSLYRLASRSMIISKWKINLENTQKNNGVLNSPFLPLHKGRIFFCDIFLNQSNCDGTQHHIKTSFANTSDTGHLSQPNHSFVTQVKIYGRQ